ncbi:hypothetical protein ACP70R_043262 [Stipagrostis hirtigluma subsp. patula]
MGDVCLSHMSAPMCLPSPSHRIFQSQPTASFSSRNRSPTLPSFSLFSPPLTTRERRPCPEHTESAAPHTAALVSSPPSRCAAPSVVRDLHLPRRAARPLCPATAVSLRRTSTTASSAVRALLFPSTLRRRRRRPDLSGPVRNRRVRRRLPSRPLPPSSAPRPSTASRSARSRPSVNGKILYKVEFFKKQVQAQGAAAAGGDAANAEPTGVLNKASQGELKAFDPRVLHEQTNRRRCRLQFKLTNIIFITSKSASEGPHRP